MHMVIFSVGLFCFSFFQLPDINHDAKVPCKCKWAHHFHQCNGVNHSSITSLPNESGLIPPPPRLFSVTTVLWVQKSSSSSNSELIKSVSLWVSKNVLLCGVSERVPRAFASLMLSSCCSFDLYGALAEVFSLSLLSAHPFSKALGILCHRDLCLPSGVGLNVFLG